MQDLSPRTYVAFSAILLTVGLFLVYFFVALLGWSLLPAEYSGSGKAGYTLRFFFGLGLLGLFAVGWAANVWPRWRLLAAWISLVFAVVSGVLYALLQTVLRPDTASALAMFLIISAGAAMALGLLHRWRR